MTSPSWSWLEDLDMSNLSNASNYTSCPHEVTHHWHSTWVNSIFGQCITNIREWFSFIIGLTSILCWLCAQAPQMYTNCKYKKADKALSFWFLLQWFIGDATNLIGALLTHQLANQIVTAVYFVIVDSLMMSQFLYYVIVNQGVRGLANCCKCKREATIMILLPGIMCTLLLATGPSHLWPSSSYETEQRHIGRTLLYHKETKVVDGTQDLIGYIIGWLSAVFYVCSRMPQIIKNFVRCSVDGVSLLMFILAVMGNVTYALGVLLYSVEPIFLLRKLPWLVGSIGTLLFDFTIFVQFLLFTCLGCGRESGTDEEKSALLRSASDSYCNGNSGLPCLNTKNSVQRNQRVALSRSGSGSPEPEVITTYYGLPKNR